MEPPSDHPLFQYFSRLDDLNNYIFNFSERVVISPRTPNIQRIPNKKILCTVFNKEMRVLHYLINYVLMPRSTGHSHVKIDDLVIMWAMVNDIKINWPYFIAQHMLRFTKSDHTKGLGYAYLWTRIFNYLEIDVSSESGRRISQNNIIDERTIHHMGRGMDEYEEQQTPQEQAGPSEQPSMRDMMQVLLRIEQNQANMDTHLTRVDQRLSRIEQYLEIDEDEDQD
ncbi:hypothetical protein PIB30_080057 [Stylosanthes scabra]|uniref:Putative plant transposon protein domain-containing protein n=1 Tax=Stylosanthes scabra TaxID=79078 RepID=A0ABU6SRJ0_9FABA|nr:hypothetical protein [Stylosanthes scabra]